MERGYANQLEAFAKRYWLQGEQESLTPKSSANRILERQASLQRLIDEQPTANDASPTAAASILSATDDGVLQCANIFFSGISRASEVLCTSKSAFSSNLLLLMNNEVADLLLEVQTVLTEARMVFIKNR